jgi:UDP-N-acetylglucosamine diphosphorylase / glucose-1-phosphate thymidylyltransferase / UDP-N-acetylgalactosamine diphosphorylase / glucosamine-1-phosphate N-acetyltransferase / galactosamine-1-phosphate N-acetyltransferase
MRKAIIMCAGKSTRTYPLTFDTPKPLLKILNKTILEYTIESLIKNKIEKIILVVGFYKEKIIEYVSKLDFKDKIIIVEQLEQKGTGHAILQTKNYINNSDSIIILNGDDLYSEKDMKNLLNYKFGALVKKVENPECFGIFSVDNKGCFKNLTEKPKENVGNLANIGCYLVNSKIIKHLETVNVSTRGEIELVDAIKSFAKNEKNEFKIVEVKDFWLPLVYPWSYLEANVFLLNKILNKGSFIKGKISKKSEVKGNVYLDEGSIIKAGSFIEGPVYIGKNVIVGPNAYLRKDTIIMDNCEVRGEIVDSVFMKNTKAKHNCYIGHSVIGENCNIAAGTITSDYRHDGKNHITLINNIKINTKRRKLGTFFGNNVYTGIGTLFYPGRKIWPNMFTLPGEIIKEDKK